MISPTVPFDPAILRPERIDRKVKVGRPDRRSSRDILGIYLHAGIPIDPDLVKEHKGDAEAARDELLDRYRAVRGVDDVGDLRYYVALYHYRLGILLEGIYQRSSAHATRPRRSRSARSPSCSASRWWTSSAAYASCSRRSGRRTQSV